jgi:hypothetical protein
MKVVSFPEKRWAEGWRPVEVTRIVGGFAPLLDSGEASGWETGTTEAGDPQLYVLGAPPDYECILTDSRLGSLYVIEEGAGHVMLEQNSLMLLAEQMRRLLRSKKAGIVARLALAWCAVRQAVTEKVEPMLSEGEELMVHFGPQLAAFA